MRTKYKFSTPIERLAAMAGRQATDIPTLPPVGNRRRENATSPNGGADSLPVVGRSVGVMSIRRSQPVRAGAGLPQGGFTLIEVLIAVLLLSIGLMGLAALQSASLSNNRSAMARSRASLLAYSILDRMRANPQAARRGQYQIGLAQAAPGGSNRVAMDLHAWKQEVASLPSGQGAVKTVGLGGQGSMVRVSVLVRWHDHAQALLGISSDTDGATTTGCPEFAEPGPNQQQICVQTAL